MTRISLANSAVVNEQSITAVDTPGIYDTSMKTGKLESDSRLIQIF